jgi:hypothetical protein
VSALRLAIFAICLSIVSSVMAAAPPGASLSDYVDGNRWRKACDSPVKFIVSKAPEALQIFSVATDSADVVNKLMLAFPLNLDEGVMGFGFCDDVLNATILDQADFEPVAADPFSGLSTYASEWGVTVVGYDVGPGRFRLLFLRVDFRKFTFRPEVTFSSAPHGMFEHSSISQGMVTEFVDWFVHYRTDDRGLLGTPFKNYLDCTRFQLCAHRMDGQTTTVTAGGATLKFSSDRRVIYDVVVGSPYLHTSFLETTQLVSIISAAENPIEGSPMPTSAIVDLKAGPLAGTVNKMRSVFLPSSCALISSEMLNDTLPTIAVRDTLDCSRGVRRPAVVDSTYYLAPVDFEAYSYSAPLLVFASSQASETFDFDRIGVRDEKLCASSGETSTCVGDEVVDKGWAFDVGPLELHQDIWDYRPVRLPADMKAEDELALTALTSVRGRAGVVYDGTRVRGFWQRMRPSQIPQSIDAEGYSELGPVGQLQHTLIDDDLGLHGSSPVSYIRQSEGISELLVVRPDQLAGYTAIKYFYDPLDDVTEDLTELCSKPDLTSPDFIDNCLPGYP